MQVWQVNGCRAALLKINTTTKRMVSHNLTGHFGAHPFLHDLSTLVLILGRESKYLRYIDHHICLIVDHV